MDREFSSDKPPDRLIEQLQANHDFRGFRRRAVLTNSNDKWWMVCCTVEALSPGESVPSPLTSRRYPQALLYEDLLTGKECLAFARELQDGTVQLGGLGLVRRENPQWTTEFLPLVNDYMTRAGHVVSLRFATTNSRGRVSPLLIPDQPYYPDVADAARDCLPFPIYHGDGDGRNDQIVFLLPENRAFLSSAAFSDTGTLKITVAGTEVSTLSLLIKGAYWEGKSIRQLEAVVRGTTVELSVPDDADRLEYYLIDSNGARYDFQSEDRFGHTGLGRKKLNASKRTLVEQVRKACRAGEGLHVEFKPFIDPDQKFTANNQKTKLREVIVTTVAFANTEGGHIYLGVDDDCSVAGIEQHVGAWTKGQIDESAIERYLGALKSKIKDLVYGEITLRLSHTEIDGALVVVIEIPPAADKPVSVRQDQHLYVRTGANNQKAPPEQWRNFLHPDKSHILL